MNSKIAWNQILITLLISFALGAAFGQWYVKSGHYRRPWHEGDMKRRIIERLDRDLALRPDQKAVISTILENKKFQMEALRNEMRPRFEVLRRTTQQEIRTVLTPEQQKQFDEMNVRMEEHFKKYGRPFGRPYPRGKRPPSTLGEQPPPEEPPL